MQSVCYLEKVDELAQLDDRRQVRSFFGLLLCLLLCGFAIGSKAALYHPQNNQLKSFASTKVWQEDSAPAVVATVSVEAAAFLFVALLAVAMAPEGRVAAELVLPLRGRHGWFTPLLAVRPPPRA